jgi:hypothetical protein
VECGHKNGIAACCYGAAALYSSKHFYIRTARFYYRGPDEYGSKGIIANAGEPKVDLKTIDLSTEPVSRNGNVYEA